MDSFTLIWHSLKFYAFPSFSVIFKTLKKIKAKKAEGISMVTYWPNQAWFPLWRKIDIVVYQLEGSSQKAIEFESMLKTYRKNRGDRQQEKDMLSMYSDSRNTDANGFLITFRQPPKKLLSI